MQKISTLFCLFLFGVGKVMGQPSPELRDSTTLATPQTIEKVVVTASRHSSDGRLAPMSLTVIDREQLEHAHRSSLLPTLSEQVPGLFTTARGVMGYGVSTGAAGTLSLRGVGGTPTTGLLMVIDGQPQYMGLMGHPIADNCHLADVERVEVVRGPASVLYGSNALGGVIHITTRKRPKEGAALQLRGGYGSYNSLESSLQGELHKGAFSGSVSALMNRSDGHRPNMEFGQSGATLRLGVELSTRWRLTADGEWMQIKSSNPGTVTAPLIDNDATVRRWRSSLRLENHYAGASGAATLFGSWGHHLINDGYHPEEAPLDYRFHSRDFFAGLSLHEQIVLGSRGRLTLGADGFHFGGRTWNRYTDGEKEPTADKEQWEVAVYADLRLQPASWLLIDGGVRFDHHSHVGAEWVPQGAVTLLLSPRSEIKLLASKGFRFPTIREMFLFPSQNPDLEPERLWSYEASFSHRHKWLRGTLSIFYIDGENGIQTQFIDGRPRNVNTGRIENWGVEGELSASIARSWSLAANYSWLRMRWPVLAAPEHKLNLSLGFNSGRWQVQSTVQYVAGLYTVLPTPTTTTTPTIESTPTKIENFVLWNLRARVQILRTLALWLRCENLLGERYEINAGFPMPRATFMAGVEFKI